MQQLHHLGVQLGIAPLQAVLDLVRTDVLGAENFGDRSAPQLGKTGVTGGSTMLAHMPSQQPRSPEFLRVARLARFRAGQGHHSGPRLRRHTGTATTSRQIGQRLLQA